MRIAVVGATGLVGREILEVLRQGGLEVSEMIPVASERSVGVRVGFGGSEFAVTGIENAMDMLPDAAIFSAGSKVSLKYAPGFADKGTVVIDNSSAWRMNADIPLVVPEVNGRVIDGSHRIIANPNCSTIQLVMVLAPLHEKYGIKRVVVATYQAVTGSGYKGLRQMEDERSGKAEGMYYPHPIDRNVIPQAGDFEENGYTSEENKLVKETRKILGVPGLRLSATAVRVPVTGGHSEAVNVELERPFDLAEIRELLDSTPGVTVIDNPAKSDYPMPLYARGRDDVFVGRIRKDLSVPNGLNLWIVSDNLRKGAATNAVQILAYMSENKLLPSFK